MSILHKMLSWIPNDPKGYKKHFFVGAVFQIIAFLFIGFWGAVVTGLFTTFLIANLWELTMRVIYGSNQSQKDILWTLAGNLAIITIIGGLSWIGLI